MKTVAFVPIKLKNERFPGKNIKCFEDGKPLLTYFLETLVQIKSLDEIYVFCSNPEVEEYLTDGVAYLKRPEFLDTKDATPQNILGEFIKRIDADIYGMCHCTSPFVTPEHFEECIQAILSEKYDSAFTAERIQRLLWTRQVTPLNFDPANIKRTQDLDKIYAEVSAAYFFKKDVFLKYKRRVGTTPFIVEVTGAESVDIDYPEDFEIANAIYQNMIKNNR